MCGGGGRRGEFFAQTPNILCFTFLVLLLWQSELIDLNMTNNILTGVLHDTSPADDCLTVYQSACLQFSLFPHLSLSTLTHIHTHAHARTHTHAHAVQEQTVDNMDMVFANGTMYVSAVSNSSCPEVTFPVKRLQKANDLVPVLCLPVTLGARALFTCDAWCPCSVYL